MIQDSQQADHLKNVQENISLCFLRDYSSLGEALLETFNCSKKKLKKYGSELDNPVTNQSEVSVSLNIINHYDVFPKMRAKLNVVYEDQFFLVINKPSKTHSVPLSYMEVDNILSSIRGSKRYAYLNQVNFPDLNRGLLNRLDYLTSGVLIFVKDLDVFNDLKANFDDLVKEKVYYAWLEGDCKFTGTVKGWLRPSGPKGAVMEFSKEEISGGIYSESEINTQVYDQKRDRTFVQVKIKTGARHQIRVHALSLGHPVLGDPIYGNKSYNRLLLHAFRYVIQRENRIFSFCAPCPFDIPDFTAP